MSKLFVIIHNYVAGTYLTMIIKSPRMNGCSHRTQVASSRARPRSNKGRSLDGQRRNQSTDSDRLVHRRATGNDVARLSWFSTEKSCFGEFGSDPTFKMTLSKFSVT